LQQNKKKAEAEGKNCHAKTMLSFGKADKAYMKDTPHVPTFPQFFFPKKICKTTRQFK
jgi:hypothetical protein